MNIVCSKLYLEIRYKDYKGQWKINDATVTSSFSEWGILDKSRHPTNAWSWSFIPNYELSLWVQMESIPFAGILPPSTAIIRWHFNTRYFQSRSYLLHRRNHHQEKYCKVRSTQCHIAVLWKSSEWRGRVDGKRSWCCNVVLGIVFGLRY